MRTGNRKARWTGVEVVLYRRDSGLETEQKGIGLKPAVAAVAVVGIEGMDSNQSSASGKGWLMASQSAWVANQSKGKDLCYQKVHPSVAVVEVVAGAYR